MLCFLHDIAVKWKLSEPCPQVPHLPLLVGLWPLHPFCALAGDHIDSLTSEEILFDQLPRFILMWNIRLNHIKHGREVEQGLPKACNKEWSTVCAIDDTMDEHVWVDLSYSV